MRISSTVWRCKRLSIVAHPFTLPCLPLTYAQSNKAGITRESRGGPRHSPRGGRKTKFRPAARAEQLKIFMHDLNQSAPVRPQAPFQSAGSGQLYWLPHPPRPWSQILTGQAWGKAWASAFLKTKHSKDWRSLLWINDSVHC